MLDGSLLFKEQYKMVQKHTETSKAEGGPIYFSF